MYKLARKLTELATRLAALPANQKGYDAQTLDAVEQLATQMLKAVSAARANHRREAGELRGAWSEEQRRVARDF